MVELGVGPEIVAGNSAAAALRVTSLDFLPLPSALLPPPFLPAAAVASFLAPSAALLPGPTPAAELVADFASRSSCDPPNLQPAAAITVATEGRTGRHSIAWRLMAEHGNGRHTMVALGCLP
jgi:hypothetical protein